MKSLKLLCVICICLVVATGIACAQGVGASGSIAGTVTDPSGAVLTNATVTATDVAKGIKHSANSDNNGHFEILGLAPATYNVSVTNAGFQTLIQKSVVVNVGQTVSLDFQLKVSGAVS